MQFQLKEHSGSRFITADIKFHADGLQLDYDLSTLEGVTWPAPGEMIRRDSLWRTTCLELFIAEPDTSRYLELNLSPSGSWNCYTFSGYRQGMQQGYEMALQQMDSDGVNRRLRALLSFPLTCRELLLGPAAVVENSAGRLFYFATDHGDKPDFHDRRFYVHAGRNHL